MNEKAEEEVVSGSWFEISNLEKRTGECVLKKKSWLCTTGKSKSPSHSTGSCLQPTVGHGGRSLPSRTQAKRKMGREGGPYWGTPKMGYQREGEALGFIYKTCINPHQPPGRQLCPPSTPSTTRDSTSLLRVAAVLGEDPSRTTEGVTSFSER